MLRAILIYAFLIAVLRIIGKRELGQANTLDLVALLLVANAVQNGISRMALRRAGISLSELRAGARREGFPDLASVQTAILETNGVVTMFREDEPAYYHPAEPEGLRIGKRHRGAD